MALGLKFRVRGVGFRVSGFGGSRALRYKVWGSGFGFRALSVQGSIFGVHFARSLR